MELSRPPSLLVRSYTFLVSFSRASKHSLCLHPLTWCFSDQPLVSANAPAGLVAPQ